ncbi:MAG: flagella basal body P-ring formation protein FlgA [Labilithrix sp.]|nr:flagella basal body P-ring formation protein FlgA [Labilithrix sp.]MCW5817654.1 flagella basal body P-ring formation protein FlgA [Labilithrix sp.]
MKVFAALVLVAGLANAAKAAPPAPAAAATTRVEVKGPRVRAKDIFPGAVADVDLGPTPPIGSTRVIEKADIEKAFAEAKAQAPKKIPSAVRVSRKTRKLSALEVDGAVKSALSTQKLPRGAELVKVRASAVEVADDYHHVNVDLPPVPRRAGPTTVQATVTFLSESADTPIFRTVVPLDVSLPPEAAFADIPRGAPITIVVKKGLVEVSVPGVAALDADVGGIVPVTLKPSGRIVRCRAVDKDHAALLEDS